MTCLETFGNGAGIGAELFLQPLARLVLCPVLQESVVRLVGIVKQQYMRVTLWSLPSRELLFHTSEVKVVLLLVSV